jgi:sugar lactone lactonase YvrE
MKRIGLICGVILMTALVFPPLLAQQVEEKDGVRFVHNVKGGKRGARPEVSLRLVRTLGGIEVQDGNFAFHFPYDVALDAAGNIYVLDEGNNRIQKFSMDGKYVATIGRHGQGPGEFESPFALDIDSEGYLYTSEGLNRRMQVLTPDGKSYKTIRNREQLVLRLRHLKSGLIATTGFPNIAVWEKKLQPLPKLVRVLNLRGQLQFEFGDLHDFKNNLVNEEGNWADFDIGPDEDFFVTFWYQNRIEKYSPEGKLLWRADRPLNYDTMPISMGSVMKTARFYGKVKPQLNSVSTGIAVDAEGRAWVATLERQLTKTEEGEVITGGHMRTVRAAPDIEKIDAYKLEIYDPDGMLLGEIKLDHRVHGLRICKNFLFIWERNFDKVYQYEIIEK